MELRQLRYFVAAAEELNFHKAAQRLHLSQPSLSQQIIALEREVGAPLLERDTKHVRLTGTGRLFLEEARRTLAQADRARDTVRRAVEGKTGSLRVGYPAFGSAPFVRRMLTTFEARHPQIEIERVAPLSSADLSALIRSRRLDAGFVRLPMEDMDGLASRTLEQDPLCALISSAHELAGRSSVRMSDLNGVSFVGLPRDQNPALYDLWMRTLFPSYGFTPSVRIEEPSLEGIMAAVVEGRGVALMPATLEDIYRSDGVRFLAIEPPRPYLDQGVVWLSSAESPPLQLLLDLCDDLLDVAVAEPVF
jgi:DNA-binding transcriptional LysR family regulator